MAFDYGSIDLGLKNPFKKEGAVTTVRGLIVTALGVYLLIEAASTVKADAAVGWIIVLFGLLLLGGGIATASAGIIALLRYFVGRNHPTSLAHNYSRSEASTAREEAAYLAYSKQDLTEMLVGRKNATFIEPQGILGRLAHSIFPRLTYMPYPVRNLAQRLFGAWIKTLVALIAYAFAAFVSLAGFAGEVGAYAFPVYSVVLTLYLILTWRAAGKSINRMADRSISSMGSAELVKIISGAILLPVVVGLGLGSALNSSEMSVAQLNQYLAFLPVPHTLIYLLSILLGAAIVTVIATIMLRQRMSYADPKVEVSELRENWQESVHPNEIFINLDNLVMANRRYKEVPNRVYQELEPTLDEQVEGKGKFFGEMIQEIQPRFKAMKLGNAFNLARLISLITGHTLFVVAAILTVLLAFTIGDAYAYFQGTGFNKLSRNMPQADVAMISEFAGTIFHLFIAGMLIRAFARILANSAHLFFAEMLFESNLIYLKIEGTFTESKISTGTGIHDSTRSENVLVRSSITPWVIVCRMVSSTFAGTGMRNLEHPRYILEMHKNDAELKSIKDDVIGFLKDRESIASITSERDLRNASQIHGINQQSRAIPMQNALMQKDEEAAGYLRQEAGEINSVTSEHKAPLEGA
ncbi:hypothetical protein [uncultured Amphritea sp.]|uniref:hypothetical protein n=1 Tax=uncultured Amphritea sp. TaxID=981605 RepID=UPI0026064EBF|nr:hypothetical protein [uncultured Amphritea sp.]